MVMQEIFKYLEIKRAKVLKFVTIFLNYVNFAPSTQKCIKNFVYPTVLSYLLPLFMELYHFCLIDV